MNEETTTPAEENENPATENEENQPPSDDVSAVDPRDEEIEKLKDQLARAVAELDNFRKSVERDRIDSAKFANASACAALLPVLDNFSRAAAARPENLAGDEWANGIESIEKQLEKTLAELGLTKIEIAAGDDIDPARHEIVLTGEGESGKILDVLEDGYEISGRVLRAAKVRVGA